jgi:uncharacterized membrane protein YoaK (UPF0700 family)
VRKLMWIGVISLMPQFVFALIYLISRFARGEAHDNSEIIVLAIELLLGFLIVSMVKWLWKARKTKAHSVAA